MKKQVNPRMVKVASKKQQAEALVRMQDRSHVLNLEVATAPVKK